MDGVSFMSGQMATGACLMTAVVAMGTPRVSTQSLLVIKQIMHYYSLYSLFRLLAFAGSTSQKGNFPWYGERCASTMATTFSSGDKDEKQVVSLQSKFNLFVGWITIKNPILFREKSGFQFQRYPSYTIFFAPPE